MVGLDDMGGSDAGRLNVSSLGTAGGEQLHTMTSAELVAHTHSVTLRNSDGDTVPARASSGGSTTSTSTGSAGSTTPFNVMQPYMLLNHIIKT